MALSIKDDVVVLYDAVIQQIRIIVGCNDVENALIEFSLLAYL